MSKQYGLIVPGKKASFVQPKADLTRPSIFDSEDDSSNDGAPLPRMRAAPIGPGANAKRQARKLQEKALEEDPTVFQYDELYDEMESRRVEDKKAKSQEVKKPKYINRLLQYAENRKLENERRIERMVQKEREQEGEEFKDKESFVTSAYRKKLEELRKAEEKEKREEYLETIGDVTKQRDLGGFYRHIYEQKLGPKEATEQQSMERKTPPPSPKENNESLQETSKKIKPAKSRAYRKRKSSEEEDEEVIQEKSDFIAKKAHLQSNLDADSDFSIDSSSDSENECNPNPTVSTENRSEPINKEITVKKEQQTEEDSIHNGKTDIIEVKVEEIKKENDKENEKESNKTTPKKNKEDIWKKRTVGEVFEAALHRYYERKAARNG